MEELLTLREVCEILKISYRHLTRLIHSGALKTVDVAAEGAKRPTYRVARSEVEEFIRSR